MIADLHPTTDATMPIAGVRGRRGATNTPDRTQSPTDADLTVTVTEPIRPEFADSPQGERAINEAAIDTFIAYLGAFPDSMELDSLWEEHPLLVEYEAAEADELALAMVAAIRETYIASTAKILDTVLQ